MITDCQIDCINKGFQKPECNRFGIICKEVEALVYQPTSLREKIGSEEFTENYVIEPDPDRPAGRSTIDLGELAVTRYKANRYDLDKLKKTVFNAINKSRAASGVIVNDQIKIRRYGIFWLFLDCAKVEFIDQALNLRPGQSRRDVETVIFNCGKDMIGKMIKRGISPHNADILFHQKEKYYKLVIEKLCGSVSLTAAEERCYEHEIKMLKLLYRRRNINTLALHIKSLTFHPVLAQIKHFENQYWLNDKTGHGFTKSDLLNITVFKNLFLGGLLHV